jgi:hypothetical protein
MAAIARDGRLSRRSVLLGASGSFVIPSSPWAWPGRPLEVRAMLAMQFDPYEHGAIETRLQLLEQALNACPEVDLAAFLSLAPVFPESYVPKLSAMAYRCGVCLIIGADSLPGHTPRGEEAVALAVFPDGQVRAIGAGSAGLDAVCDSLTARQASCGGIDIDLTNRNWSAATLRVSLASSRSSAGSAIYDVSGQTVTRSAPGWTQAIFARLEEPLLLSP